MLVCVSLNWGFISTMKSQLLGMFQISEAAQPSQQPCAVTAGHHAGWRAPHRQDLGAGLGRTEEQPLQVIAAQGTPTTLPTPGGSPRKGRSFAAESPLQGHGNPSHRHSRQRCVCVLGYLGGRSCLPRICLSWRDRVSRPDLIRIDEPLEVSWCISLVPK